MSWTGPDHQGIVLAQSNVKGLECIDLGGQSLEMKEIVAEGSNALFAYGS